jgi:hypothetical protein
VIGGGLALFFVAIAYPSCSYFGALHLFCFVLSAPMLPFIFLLYFDSPVVYVFLKPVLLPLVTVALWFFIGSLIGLIVARIRARREASSVKQ